MLAEIDKARLLDLLEAEYEFVHRTIDDLLAEVMLMENVTGTWSIKDMIAHLTAWMKRLLRWFDEIEAGQTPDVPEKGYTWDAVDALNDAQSVKDKNRSLDDVLADFHNVYHEVYRLIEGLSEDDLFHSTFDGLTREPMWRLIVSNTYEHFHEHIKPVREWLAKNA